jgi:hypothetical protein
MSERTHERLSDIEHDARAMLLGRWYEKRTHTYAVAGQLHIDADTLETVDFIEWCRRFDGKYDR